MVVLNICICCIIFLIGFNVKNIFSDFSKKDKYFLNQLLIYHFVIAIIFHFYIFLNGGDAIYYWSNTKAISFSEIIELVKTGSATGTMHFINYFPANVLNLSFFTGNMLYSLIGYLGFMCLYRILKPIIIEKQKMSSIKIFGIPIFPWIWFLPNLHFWSSGIGKDSLLFFAIALFIYSLQAIKRRWWGILLSVLISLTIRPHIMLFLLFAFGIAYILDGRLKAYQKTFIFLLFIISFLSIFNYVVDFVQLESLESSAITEYASTKASKLNLISSGSGVDISRYPILLKIFTFLYRPLFFDINGILALVASIDNLIFLVFSYKVIRSTPIRTFKRANYIVKGSVIYFFIGTLAFSMILGNLGIMLRQKNMFIPCLILFGLYTLYDRQVKLIDTK